MKENEFHDGKSYLIKLPDVQLNTVPKIWEIFIFSDIRLTPFGLTVLNPQYLPEILVGMAVAPSANVLRPPIFRHPPAT